MMMMMMMISVIEFNKISFIIELTYILITRIDYHFANVDTLMTFIAILYMDNTQSSDERKHRIDDDDDEERYIFVLLVFE
jgi:uncharacterized membrane protein